jgi:hypothetical protein
MWGVASRGAARSCSLWGPTSPRRAVGGAASRPRRWGSCWRVHRARLAWLPTAGPACKNALRSPWEPHQAMFGGLPGRVAKAARLAVRRARPRRRAQLQAPRTLREEFRTTWESCLYRSSSVRTDESSRPRPRWKAGAGPRSTLQVYIVLQVQIIRHSPPPDPHCKQSYTAGASQLTARAQPRQI